MNYDWKKALNTIATLSEQVEYILRQRPETRNWTGDQFISFMKSNGVRYASESIVRARRKIKEKYPELKEYDEQYKIAKTQNEIGILKWCQNA